MPLCASRFRCISCDYSTSHKSHYDKHIATQKHISVTNTYGILQKVPESAVNFYTCLCGKKYTHRQSLHYHKKTCSIIEKNSEEKTDSTEENITIEI